MNTITVLAWMPISMAFDAMETVLFAVAKTAESERLAVLAAEQTMEIMGSPWGRTAKAILLRGMRYRGPGGRAAAMAQAIEWRNVKVAAGRIKQFGVAGQR